MWIWPRCRLIAIALTLVVGLTVSGVTLADEPQRPNVLLLVSDDQRPDTIHALGNDLIRTPSWDRLVAEGTTFTRAITAMPLCVASRAELLTGRDGLFNGFPDHGMRPKEGVPHLARTLQADGYDTWYVGKWHTRGRPGGSGYQRVAGLFGAGAGKYPLTHPVDWKGMPVTGYRGWMFQSAIRQLYPNKGVGLTPDISETFADETIRVLKQERTKPLFLHVNFTAPHDPLFWPTGHEDSYAADEIPLPENFEAEHPFDHGNLKGRDEVLFGFPRTSEETREAIAVYYAVLTHLDEQVGRILDVLDETGLADDTIVIYTSDHGLAMGSHGLRGKQNMYEHTIGVPLIMRGPSIPQGQSTAAQCYLRDLYPTICDMASVAIPETVQGRSLKSVLDGEQEQVYDAVFAHFMDSQRMIRTSEWKYVVYPQVNREQLFHVTDDPDELHNLAEDSSFSPIKARLKSRLLQWRQERADPTL